MFLPAMVKPTSKMSWKMDEASGGTSVCGVWGDYAGELGTHLHHDALLFPQRQVSRFLSRLDPALWSSHHCICHPIHFGVCHIERRSSEFRQVADNYLLAGR